MKLWLSLSAALVFAAGCAVGLLLNTERYHPRIAASSSAGGNAGESVVPSVIDPYPDYLLYLVSGEDVYEELGLDQNQRDRLEKLFADHSEAVRDIGLRMGQVAAELEDGVMEVLTDEQEARFSEMQKRCSTSRIRFRVERELVELREELDLRPEQVPAIYRHLFDAEMDRHKIYGKKRCRETRKQMKQIDDELIGSLRIVLFPNQLEAYLKIHEQKRRFRTEDASEQERELDRDGQ